jgi:hypothetical protein
MCLFLQAVSWNSGLFSTFAEGQRALMLKITSLNALLQATVTELILSILSVLRTLNTGIVMAARPAVK